VRTKDSPKDVRIEPRPRLEVKENEPFSLDCTGRSNPSIDSYTWIKNNEEVKINTKIYLVNATSPSDSGWYRCEARNTLGTGKSQPVEVKVKCGIGRTATIFFICFVLVVIILIFLVYR
uniref:Ig-like domain-containing protein n=1 Tax=Nothobranchius furzeri TaxID=105023 RepID=A0A8C6LZB9_NOTFU